MAVIVKTVNDIGVGDRILPANGDIIIINEGVAVVATGLGGDGMQGIFNTNLTVQINGILAGEDNGAEVGADSTVSIGINGSLVGKNNALYLSGDGIAVNNAGALTSEGVQGGALYLTSSATDAAIANSGSITSANIGVRIEAVRANITNTGMITGTADAISSTFAADIDNAGTITSSEGNALDFSTVVGAVDINNSGLIDSELEAIIIDGGGNSIVNTGTITSDVSSGIDITGAGPGTFVSNSGTIEAEDEGIYILGTDSSVINDGNIVSRSAQGVWLSGAASSLVVNNGTITAELEGVYVSGDNFRIVNTGVITSLDQEAVGLNVVNAGNTSTLINKGTIATVDPGGLPAVIGDGSSTDSDHIRNLGTIDGGMDLNGGDDIVTNRGLIIGDVLLDSGNDTFDGRHGEVNGSVIGGLGDDTYIVSDTDTDLVENASEGTDTVKARVSWELGDNFETLNLVGSADISGFGNGLDNIVSGNFGDNRLDGSGGNDGVYGGTGNDRVRGGLGNDTVRGGNGDDVVLGNGGDDFLYGDNDDDVLNGGLGYDQMWGGTGDDIFKFTRTAHSPDVATADDIKDFAIGEDLIDVSDLAPGEIDFIGGAAFSGTGTAELRVVVFGGVTSIVRVDANGDGVADMRVDVEGVTTLSALDFIL